MQIKLFDVRTQIVLFLNLTDDENLVIRVVRCNWCIVVHNINCLCVMLHV